MKADTSARRKGSTAIDHPALAESLVTLARSLDRRAADDEAIPSYLDLAVLVADVQSQLDDLTRQLVHYARRYERTTWKDIADTFGISRPTVYKRFGETSDNDPDGDTGGGNEG
jgi:CRP-like cAMP-binding protein